jgi:predicted nucleic acid binding AN1-type Zn finger protein
MAEALSQQSNFSAICEEKKSSIGICNIGSCTKKLGILPFICRCQKEYCTKHRMPETHECTFDYKTTGRIALQAANQKFDFVKVKKI